MGFIPVFVKSETSTLLNKSNPIYSLMTSLSNTILILSFY